MQFITVAHWHPNVTIKELGHNSRFAYTEEKRNDIINMCLKNDHNVMLQKVKDGLIIWIDKGKFRQS